ncbi:MULTISPECIES: MFS transporter [unclassified Streptomyces]|uniref:MFS transporter n=1 Tax=unclassified Streptomyces TaxID=2593676 RepID=UPI00316AE444
MRAGAAATQFTVTACLAGLAIGPLIAGTLSDTYGRRRPLLAGLALYMGVEEHRDGKRR